MFPNGEAELPDEVESESGHTKWLDGNNDTRYT